MSEINRKWTNGMLRTEDWWAVWLGLTLFAAGLLSIWNIDMVGWMAKTKTWEITQLLDSVEQKGITVISSSLLKPAHGKAEQKEIILRINKNSSGVITSITSQGKKPVTRKIIADGSTLKTSIKGKLKTVVLVTQKNQQFLVLNTAQSYAWLGGFGSLLLTWLVFTVLTTIGAYFQKLHVRKFFLSFSVLFFITFSAWMIGHEAHFKAAKTSQSMNQPTLYGDDVYCLSKVQKCTKALNKTLKSIGINVAAGQIPSQEQAAMAVTKTNKTIRLSWGLQLGGGFSYLLALFVGLFIGNVAKGFSGFLSEAAKPEWYIKTAIVYLGVKLGHMSIKSSGQISGSGDSLMLDLALAGAAATFVAYLMFWPIVYTLGRRLFKLRRDASAVLSSGISICGVSAAIATAGAIRAKPILPIAVSMLIVVFAMIELLILPSFLAAFSPDQPIVNGAALGMTVKTDGADAAAGAILDELMVAQHYTATGELWEEDWILAAAVLTKIWIDVFIGVWAFVLALIWVYKVEQKPGHSHVGVSEIWFRFPKFVIGYFIAWFSYVAIVVWFPDSASAADTGANIVQSPMRKMMFMLTFVAIGTITDFSKLKGMGKLTLLYAIALFAIIAPIAYLIAYIFHNGLVPPVIPVSY